MKTRILLTSILVALMLVGMLVPAAIADEATDDVGSQPTPLVDPNIASSAQATPKAVPTAGNPEDVLWDQYNNFSGGNYAAQDFEAAFDIYDIWAADDFANAEAWTIDTIVTRGGWTGFVDLNNATAIHWYICADDAGVPGCVPGDGSEFWTAHLAPSDPQVGLGVVEPEDVVLALDTPINLPAGTWWLIHQVSLEYGLWGQWGWSGTADPVWGSQGLQINPGNGFGNGTDWWPNTGGVDHMFRLEGTTGGVQEPDIRIDPATLDATLCPDETHTTVLNICNDGTAGLVWALSEVPAGGHTMDVLWDNGPLVTHPGACSGQDASRLQTGLSMNTLGFGHQFIYGYRMADDFEIADPDGWNVDQITFFAYQTNAPSDPSPITGLYYQIWDGPPDDPGSSVVFGDLVTNRLTSTTFSGIQRDSETSPCAGNRYIFADVGSAGTWLAPGTYWLDWMTDGNLSSGPWAPPITVLGETTTGNALQYTTAWAAALDTGTLTQQGMPFVIEGTPGGMVDIPWLSEDPTTGEVAPGECQEVSVTFDSTGLALGTYYGELLIDSNDPDTPELYVPVTLTVEECVENTMHVHDILGLGPVGGRWIMKVLVADQNHEPLTGVLVDATITTPMFEWGRYRYTNLGGWARFWTPLDQVGNYEICIDDLTLDGYLYNPDDNVYTCMDWDYGP